jgi:2-iminobutanoate/2-iminopropanoate deaminase
MNKPVTAAQAPQPIGPYNQAVWAGPFLYISGQIALVGQSGKLRQENIMAETEQVMHNLGHILQAAGLDYQHLVKCSIFVTDLEHFSAVNGTYATFLPEKEAPARETIQVARLPKDARVEISAVAYRGGE